MNVEEFLKRHPKPWRQASDLASPLTVEYLDNPDAAIDGAGRVIGSRDLLEYIEAIEVKPVEELFGTMPNIKALTNCSFRCQSTEIKFNQLGRASCNRCGRFRTYYDKKG